MNVLVTGGAGFIGTHLCGELLKQNHKVVCVDNFTLGSEENVSDLMKTPSFDLIEEDVSDIERLSRCVSLHRPYQYIFYHIQCVRGNALEWD